MSTMPGSIRIGSEARSTPTGCLLLYGIISTNWMSKILVPIRGRRSRHLESSNGARSWRNDQVESVGIRSRCIPYQMRYKSTKVVRDKRIGFPDPDAGRLLADDPRPYQRVVTVKVR